MNLRPYQQQLITDIRLQYQLGHRSVLAVLPTGGGKTVCFSYIAQAAARKGNRVCILGIALSCWIRPAGALLVWMYLMGLLPLAAAWI